MVGARLCVAHDPRSDAARAREECRVAISASGDAIHIAFAESPGNLAGGPIHSTERTSRNPDDETCRLAGDVVPIEDKNQAAYPPKPGVSGACRFVDHATGVSLNR